MFIRLGYDIEFEIPAPVAMVSMLNVHPSRSADLRAPDEMQIEPGGSAHQLHGRFRQSLHALRRAPGKASSVLQHSD